MSENRICWERSLFVCVVFVGWMGLEGGLLVYGMYAGVIDEFGIMFYFILEINVKKQTIRACCLKCSILSTVSAF